MSEYPELVAAVLRARAEVAECEAVLAGIGEVRGRGQGNRPQLEGPDGFAILGPCGRVIETDDAEFSVEGVRWLVAQADLYVARQALAEAVEVADLRAAGRRPEDGE